MKKNITCNSFIPCLTVTQGGTLKYIKAKLLVLVLHVLPVPVAMAQITPATPRYQESSVNVTTQSHIDGTITFKARKFSLDAAGTQWRIGLLQNKIPGVSPEINVVAYNQSIGNPPVRAMIMDALDVNGNSDGLFGNGLTDDMYAPYWVETAAMGITPEYFSKTAVTGLWSVQKIVEYLNDQNAHPGWQWHGFDQAGNVPINVFIRNEDIILPDVPNALAYYNPLTISINIPALPHSDPCQAGVNLALMGHEFFHGIWAQIPSLHASSGIYYRALNEGLADIFGVMGFNHYRASQGQPFTWATNYYDQLPPQCTPQSASVGHFYYPNDTGISAVLPVHGGNFYIAEFQKPKPSEHKIGWIMRHWFYMIAEGASGTNELGKTYDITGIGTEKAMDLVFDVVINWGATPASTDPFHRFAIASSQAAISKYGYGSLEHISVMSAWEALGMFIGGAVQEVNYTAQSLYNGEVSLKVKQYTVLGKKACFMESGITTPLELLYSSNIGDMGIGDLDEDHVFFEDNDPDRSKKAVNAYWGLLYTKDYLDQQGIHLDNINPNNLIWTGEFKDNKKAVLENVAGELLNVVNSDLAGITDPLTHNERFSVLQATSDIFGIMVKNKWRAEQPDPSKQDPTYLYGEDATPGGTRNFANPKALALPSPDFYKGKLFSLAQATEADARNNSSIMSHWYYLLTEGGSGYQDDNVNKGSYYLPGVGRKYADQIMMELINQLNLPNNTINTFADAREMTLKIADKLFSNIPFLKNEIVNNMMEAWYAVGIGDGAATTVQISPADQESQAPMWPTVLKFDAKFNSEVEWEVMISEVPDFSVPGKTKTLICNKGSINAAGKMQASIDVDLDASMTYYWKVRPTKLMNPDGTLVNSAHLFGQEEAQQGILWSWRRTFTTEPCQPKLLHPFGDSFYPWGGTFKWSGVAGNVETYRIKVAENDQFVNIDTYLNYAYKPTTLGQQEWKGVNLKVGQNYHWMVEPIGPAHTIYKGTNLKRPAKGTPSSPRNFHTTTPSAECLEPINASKQPPWNITVSAKPVDGATDYRYSIGVNANSFSVNDLHIPGIKDETFMITTELGLLPGTLSDDQTIYWRVKPVGPELPLDKTGQPIREFGTAKSYSTFKLDYSLVRTGLTSPTDGIRLYKKYGTNLHFKWTEAKAGSGGYMLQVYKNGVPFKDSGNTPLIDNVYTFNNSVFYDAGNANYTWEVLTLPPAGSGSANLPKVKSAQFRFNLDPDIPTSLKPGVNCKGDCDALYNTNNPPVIAYDENASINFQWESHYAPNGYNLRVAEWGANSLVIDEILTATNPLTLSKTIPMKDLKPNTTYTWGIWPILNGQANATTSTSGGLPINTDTPSPIMFRTGSPPEPEWSGPIEFVFEEASAKAYDFYVYVPPGDYEVSQSTGYDKSKYEFWYDGPVSGAPPVGSPPVGVTTSSSQRTVDVVRILNPVPGGVYTLGVMFWGLNDDCPYPFKISVRQNGKEKAVIQNSSITCDMLQNYDEIEFTYTYSE